MIGDMPSTAPDPLPPGLDPLAVARRFEPVVRYTQGELFFPMAVEDYVARAALWSRPAVPAPGRRDRSRSRVADHGELTLDGLLQRADEHRDSRLELRTVPGPLARRERLQWRRRPDRARLSSTSRLATVGLLGRLIDVLFRLSLVVRGAVPGGLTAAIQQAHPTPADPHAGHPYYAHVSTDGRYLVVQYWFFYAMNDWRSTFGGVNDHEADWEQVTVFLSPRDGWPDPGGGGLPTDPADWRVTWVAFSSHDETGDDLRRRADDPDISWVGDTHPVVHAGAGSHSGAYLPGDYLIRVEPPALQRFLAAVRRTRRALFPWTDDEHKGLGIPYVDYARGDGRHIGPGTDHPWQPVLVDDDTPWVRDYPGLWGLDTDDPFGGERAPGGPRYERGGTIRASWGDPVGWAGLAKVPATAAELHATQQERLATLGRQEQSLSGDIAQRTRALQSIAVGVDAVPPTLARERGGIGARRRVREQESAVADLEQERRTLVVEREYLQRAINRPVETPPHAHLRHRAVPDIDPDRPPGLLLRVWTEASLSVLLALLGVALLLGYDSALLLGGVAILAVTAVEAVLRGRIATYLVGLAVLVVIGGSIYLAVTNLRVALAGLLLLAAVAGAVANVRALLRRR